MTDLSTTLSSILIEKHSSKTVIGRKRDLSENLDSFLKEAYNIVGLGKHSSIHQYLMFAE